MPHGTAGRELASVMARVAAGDRDAFAELYDATSRRVFGIALRVLHDARQAEDVVRETYLEAWRAAGRGDAVPGSPAAWLTSIAHRRAVGRVRAAERSAYGDQARSSDPAGAGHQGRAGGPEADPVADPVADTSGRADNDGLGWRLPPALARLPEDERAVLALAYFDGRHLREVAEGLDVPLHAATTRIRDAMTTLRAELDEVADDD